MASEEMKKIRQSMTKESIRDAQMSKNTGTETELFRCGKCGKRKTTYTQVFNLHAAAVTRVNNKRIH